MKKINFNDISRRNKIRKRLRIIFFPVIILYKEFLKEPIGFTLFFGLIIFLIYANSERLSIYIESVLSNKTYNEILSERRK